MKVSVKKKRFYKMLERIGNFLFIGTLVITLFLDWIVVDVGNAIVSGFLMAIGFIISCIGAKGRSELYICPVCKRRLLLPERFRRNRVMDEPPEVCPCGWRVQIEYE